MDRLAQLAKRRTELVAQIGQSRQSMRTNLLGTRNEFIFAGLGIVLTRLLAKHPILRTVALIAFALNKAWRN
jgi:hypothetical protein